MTINISGKVIRGEGYGKKLGFPTANIDRRDFVRRKLKVKLGIYAGFAELNLKSSSSAKASADKKILNLKSAIVVGPLDKDYLPKIEAHLVGFKGNLYGKKLTIILKKYLRPFKQFKSEAELKAQIAKDVKKAKSL